MTIIYQPSGRAAEYAEWAANLFRGCPHQCAYCFAPSMLRMQKYEFHKAAVPRKDIVKRLQKSAEKQAEPRMVHLCFTCDPYPTIYDHHEHRQRTIIADSIAILKQNLHAVQILTKGGSGSDQDFDLLDERDEYAATLTLDNDEESRLWEPHAALPWDRISALGVAASFGITTWASLEPVIFPAQSLAMLEAAIDAGVSKVKIGPLNYKGRLPKWLACQVPDDIDWQAFVDEAQRLCKSADVECYLKNDMRALLKRGP